MNPVKYHKKPDKVKTKYYCKTCEYKTGVKHSFNKHLLTIKHGNRQTLIKPINNNGCNFFCECGKKYAHKTTLCAHKKKCLFKQSTSDEAVTDAMVNELKDIVISQQNVIQQMGDLIPMMGNNNTVINNTAINNTAINNTAINNNNQNFNINIFLNDKCQNALNMSDFIKSIQFQIEDLDLIKSDGLVEGVSSAIVKSLNNLDLFKRPIHCTDVKREILYIKENDAWGKEDEGKEILREAIKLTADKQREAIMDEADSKIIGTDKEKDEYVQLVRNVMKDILEKSNEKKIMKTIAKETIIDKDSVN